MMLEKIRKFWWVGLIILIVLVLIVLMLIRPRDNNSTNSSQSNEKNNTNTPPLLIKSLPVNIAPYDPTTNMAGDFKFTKQELQFGILYFDYGFTIPASPDYPAKDNPQPTFTVPLGTKVRSIVDGYVVDMPKVWSGDYSILVGEKNNKDNQYLYEMEHVINPVVKVGDKVTAGQIVAEVSDYDTKNTPGYGLVEIGILKGGSPPSHLCPYLYLDPTVKDKILNSLDTLRQDWNTYKGKEIYESSGYAAPGCIKTDGIEG